MAFVNGAALAVVNDVTIAPMSSPDPTPWEEMTVLGDAAEDALELEEIGVLMLVLGFDIGLIKLSAMLETT
jgi:hypothetical protein